MSTLEPSALRWRKSSHSGASGGECVEVAAFSSTIAVRDSKNPGGPVLAFGADEWRVFSQHVRCGER
ncbi:DUF397 domain-containing protein [Actinomadura kijaniata]|uniref:DUF397 domain-containing protein n=1 Tax=Actinomadura kijaniata TaxID=46161 RepID=UPI003F1E21CD